MVGKEGGHAVSGQDRSWLAQFQSGKLLFFRRYSVCALKIVSFECLSTRAAMYLLQSLGSPAFACVHRTYVCLHHYACGANLLEFSSLRPPSSKPSLMCTIRVSVGCAPKWTAVSLSRHAAVSQADMDETDTSPTSSPVPKCDIDVPSRSRSQS